MEDSRGEWKTAGVIGFWPKVTQLPMLPELLNPCVGSIDIWHCSSDTGLETALAATVDAPSLKEKIKEIHDARK